jgi:capsid portal protein
VAVVKKEIEQRVFQPKRVLHGKVDDKFLKNCGIRVNRRIRTPKLPE